MNSIFPETYATLAHYPTTPPIDYATRLVEFIQIFYYLIFPNTIGFLFRFWKNLRSYFHVQYINNLIRTYNKI